MSSALDANAAPKGAYWCFISYRHADNKTQGRQWATWLHHQIETYEVPADLIGKINERGDPFPERIFPVFRDEDELPADADLASPIYRALDRSKFLVVLCSPQSAGSTYVGDEIRYFKQIGKSARVLAALIEGEPNVSWDLGKHRAGMDPSRECFPKALQHPVDATGNIIESERAEPIAADFRLPNGDQGWTTPAALREALKEDSTLSEAAIASQVADYGKRCELAKLKIIAGILGIPLGQLTRRDKAYQLEKERQRAKIFRRVAIAMVTLAVLALFAGGFALVREKDARKAKATSDDLSEFMIGDLYERLNRIGRIDLLDEAAARLEKNLNAGYAVKEKPDLLRYLRLKFQISKIRLAQGRITEAYQIVHSAAKEARGPLASDPEVSLVIADLESLASDIGIRIGAPDGEKSALRAAEIFREQGQPGRLAQALVNLTDYDLQRRDFYAAERLTDEATALALDASNKSAATEPRETLLRILLRKSRLKSDQENFQQAIAILAERASYIDAFSKKDPDHWLWDREKVLNGIEESKLQLKLADKQAALEIAEKSLREALVLETRDPSNLEWSRIAATAYNHRAFVKLALQNYQEALADFDQGLVRFKKLTEFSPGNLGWRSSLAWTHDGLRTAAEKLGETDQASAHAQECTRLLRSVYEELGRPVAAEATRELMMALTNAANFQTDAFQLEEAAESIQEAAGLADKLAAPARIPLSDAILCANISFTQAQILSARSQPLPAITAARTGRSYFEKTTSADRRLAIANMRVAALEAENALVAEARQSATAAISILEKLPTSPESSRDLETARAFLANLPL